jgi:hypothetical protein
MGDSSKTSPGVVVGVGKVGARTLLITNASVIPHHSSAFVLFLLSGQHLVLLNDK